MKSILDPSFRYTPSHATDVRRTFERVRREAALDVRSRGDLLRVLPMPASPGRMRIAGEGKP